MTIAKSHLCYDYGAPQSVERPSVGLDPPFVPTFGHAEAGGPSGRDKLLLKHVSAL